MMASDELPKTDWRRRLAVRFHLFMCWYCRRYARQIESLGDGARGIFGESPADPATRDRLRDSILGEIPPDRES